MFAVFSRSVTRRATSYSVRCMSNVPPRQSPPPSKSSDEPISESPEPQSQTPVEEVEPLSRSGVPSLDFMPPDPSEERQRTGARSSKDTLSSAEQQRRNMGRVTAVLLTLGFGLNVAHMGREWSAEELNNKKMTIENAPSTRWGRTKQRFTDFFGYFSEPAWSELLPPPYPPPHQKPYTLLLSVDDLLVTSTWDRQHGWRTAKRPGVDYFLAYISQFYEVVIFTTQHAYTASPILDQLDRYNFFVSHRLFREATRSHNGQVVKDLSYLNRDLSKVILLDTESSHAATHPENAIIIPKWKGDSKDRGLVDMIPFLESIAIYKPPDVRPILEAYQGKNIPVEYAKKEAEGKAKHLEEWKQNKGNKSNSIGSFFGLSKNRTDANAPLTYLEQKRKEAQMQYKEEQAYIAKNKDYLEKLLKQEQDMMAAQVPKNLWEAIDQMRGNPPKALEGQPGVQPQPEAPATSKT
ncbi:mitochondrial import inner membrane translocase subunit tim50 [Moniliophthora roreri MCA 2997]|uniref:Mitochondrial import inner membrane translocase subunit TIM50 n=1 Tax=Moniliophthora roreri (strain MCA 2997) TaxID=1381753 RepID=V2YFV1_MONRO|nr:mitochondrial import inner membrane translocase subunit tim50 [Moniliophthora roreri MCA 2997]